MSAENPPAASQRVDVGNPKDIQGILALTVVGGAFVVAGAAIVTQSPVAIQVLTAVLSLAGTIVGFYFGQKSQQ